MPVENFIVPGHRAVLRRADVVFLITEPQGSNGRRAIGHAGLVARDTPNYGRGDSVPVIHMTDKVVAQHIWSATPSPDRGATGERTVQLVADVSGFITAIEEGERDDVIATAASFHRRISFLEPNREGSCYLQGNPDPTAHPDHPGVPGAYAFSCTTFVHHCYAKVATLVDVGAVPVVTPTERSFLARIGLRVQPTPFRRLSCGHLISALQQEPQHFPFRPSNGNWSAYGDVAVFQRLIDEAANAPKVERTSGRTAPPPATLAGGGRRPLASRVLSRVWFFLRRKR